MSLSNIKVPHVGPKDAKLLIVGEAPGKTENELKEPFVGESGLKLMETLALSGIQRNQVRLANILNYQPKDNQFHHAYGTSQLREGVDELLDYIRSFRPNCVLLLGETPLAILTDRAGIGYHRGSVLSLESIPEQKAVASFHPAWILRNPSEYFIFAFDIARAIQQSKDKSFPYRKRSYHILSNIWTPEYHEGLQKIKEAKRKTVDIETQRKFPKDIICVGFGISSEQAYVIPYNNHTYGDIANCLATVEDTKCFHFGFCFDIPRLRIAGIEVAGRIEDTYVLTHALQPSLPKALDFLTSIYTYEPYYKRQGRATLPGDTKDWGEKVNKNDVYEYNGKDCCVQYEVWDAMLGELTNENDRDTYDFELEDSVFALELSFEGMPYDKRRKDLIARAVISEWNRKQGLLTILTQSHVNVQSPFLKKLLYGKLGLPEQTKLDHKTKTYKVTCDDKALTKLLGFCQDRINSLKTPAKRLEWEYKQLIVRTIQECRGDRKLLSSYLLTKMWNDERVLAIYNAAGTETGRWAATMFIDDTGFNPQTLPRLDFEVPSDKIEEWEKIPVEDFLEKNMGERVKELVASIGEEDV
jgi:uracil-DNA glycosylase family 4